MPELPEVHTTATGLNRRIVGLKITDAWTDYGEASHAGSDSIKDPAYFLYFKKSIRGARIKSVGRRAKNVLIHLESGDVILIHMKMTGHIMHGRYVFDASKARRGEKDPWTPATHERAALFDPFNRFIHFVLTLSDGARETQLVLSDMRKFAKVALIPANELAASAHTSNIGPEPLDADFTFDLFKQRLNRKPRARIKTALMDQHLIAGIGNIYSDEALWRASIHPETRVSAITTAALKELYTATKAVLEQGIDFGGDSMSDYRNVDGERGAFQGRHEAYRKTGQRCARIVHGVQCKGSIRRKVVGGRSAHYCDVHQKLITDRTSERERRPLRPLH